MQVQKATEVKNGGVPTAVQLQAINALARAEMTEDQVYVFSLRLCDDRVDRDFERFDSQALPVLAKLFIGKTGIVDHKWSAREQIARIFAAEVVQQSHESFIKAWAYIRRGSGTEEIIADIEAGIKKEVSVGCAMGRAVCSVCGEEYGQCGHRKGEYYDGQLCCAILREPMDAYEFSFVAVPAQKDAGVLKGFGSNRTLKELAEEFGVQGEYRQLVKMAKLGQQYRKETEAEVVRLCLALELGVEKSVLSAVMAKASPEELGAMKSALEEKLAMSIPAVTQLGRFSRKEEALESGFLI